MAGMGICHPIVDAWMHFFLIHSECHFLAQKYQSLISSCSKVPRITSKEGTCMAIHILEKRQNNEAVGKILEWKEFFMNLFRQIII